MFHLRHSCLLCTMRYFFDEYWGVFGNIDSFKFVPVGWQYCAESIIVLFIWRNWILPLYTWFEPDNFHFIFSHSTLSNWEIHSIFIIIYSYYYHVTSSIQLNTGISLFILIMNIILYYLYKTNRHEHVIMLLHESSSDIYITSESI